MGATKEIEKGRAALGFAEGAYDKARTLQQMCRNILPTAEMLEGRMMMQRLMITRFAQGWQWSVEADDMPDLDMFAKDITYGAGTIETESRKIGAGEFNKPTSRSSGTITMTVRDTEQRAVAAWFDYKKSLITNPDGTLNLPGKYTFNIRVYQHFEHGKILDGEWLVMATQRGECTRSRDQLGEFFSYTLTFTKYSSYGALEASTDSKSTSQPATAGGKK